MFQISVIICTHNPHQGYLGRVIEALRIQTLPIKAWELIIVDNASRRPISDVIDLSWHMHGRCVVESELGLSSARRRGIQESGGSLLVFVDDDNVLSPDYLTEALRIAEDWRCLGAWGSGSIALEFEAQPADHLQPYLGFLGVRDASQPVWSNAISCTDATPIGAGLCIRRQTAEAYLEFCRTSSIQISGRKGSSLGAHEDYEICYLACKAGLGMGIFPELKILHLIVKERVSDSHLLNLIESVTSSHLVLDYKWKGKFPPSPFSLHGFASFLLNLVQRRGFDRRVFFAELRAVIAARRVLTQGIEP
jgi:GT2 family glycosyltransferase